MSKSPKSPAVRAREWRDRQRADAETDAAIVRGFMLASRGYLRDGRPMMAESEPRVRDICAEAMAHLSRTASIQVPEAVARVTARLAAALDRS